VLVVSESPGWRGELVSLLEAEGYAVCLDERGDVALDDCPFDIAVVDLAITGRSAAAVFAALRAHSSLPIVAVSPEARREPAVLEAYAAGVDLLVNASMRPRELMARIRALLRRSPPRPRGVIVLEAGGVGSIGLDVARGVATVADVDISLTPYESEILYALLLRPGRVVTRERLAHHGRGRHGDRALDSLVRSLRNKLEGAEGHRRIVAVRGVGFRLVPDVELATAEPTLVGDRAAARCPASGLG
jgi:DNA-binding response OmpR family regulator